MAINQKIEMTTKLLGVHIFVGNHSDLRELIALDLADHTPLTIAKLNSEFLLRIMRNPEFKETLKSFSLNIPDGIALPWASKYLSLPVSKNTFIRSIQSIFQMVYTGASLVIYPPYAKSIITDIFPGQECFYLMLEAAEKAGRRVYFFGGREEVLKKTISQLKEKLPNLKIVGHHDGYSDKGAEVVADINKTKAEILFVALGSPEQELWIRDNLAALKKVEVAIGEGGTFDFIAGAAKRAPRVLNKIGLEWIWRIFFSPNLTTGAGNRLKRAWNAVPVFIYEMVKYKIKYGEEKNKTN